LGYFTFYNSNGQSIVDYMIASHGIFYDIEHFIVHSPVEFSEHCLISVGVISLCMSHLSIMNVCIVNDASCGPYD
jgi:hypothetical protein